LKFLPIHLEILAIWDSRWQGDVIITTTDTVEPDLLYYRYLKY